MESPTRCSNKLTQLSFSKYYRDVKNIDGKITDRNTFLRISEARFVVFVG